MEKKILVKIMIEYMTQNLYFSTLGLLNLNFLISLNFLKIKHIC